MLRCPGQHLRAASRPDRCFAVHCRAPAKLLSGDEDRAGRAAYALLPTTDAAKRKLEGGWRCAQAPRAKDGACQRQRRSPRCNAHLRTSGRNHMRGKKGTFDDWADAVLALIILFIFVWSQVVSTDAVKRAKDRHTLELKATAEENERLLTYLQTPANECLLANLGQDPENAAEQLREQQLTNADLIYLIADGGPRRSFDGLDLAKMYVPESDARQTELDKSYFANGQAYATLAHSWGECVATQLPGFSPRLILNSGRTEITTQDSDEAAPKSRLQVAQAELPGPHNSAILVRLYKVES